MGGEKHFSGFILLRGMLVLMLRECNYHFCDAIVVRGILMPFHEQVDVSVRKYGSSSNPLAQSLVFVLCCGHDQEYGAPL